MKLQGMSADVGNKMASKMAILWVLLILSPLKLHGIVVTDENFGDILKTKFQLPNDNIVSLRDLYGSKVTAQNFNPGPAVLRHIETKDHKINDLFHFPVDKSTTMDDILFPYLNPVYDRIQDTDSTFMLINGNTLSGKTRALRIFESLLLSSAKSSNKALAIYVDIEALSKKNLFPSKIPKNFKIDDIIRCGIKDDYVPLIKNIIQVNPRKIQFFLDNIDRLPQYKKELMSAIEKLVSKKIGVVITTSTDSPTLEGLNLTPELSLLPNQLVDQQISDFLSSYWTKKLSINNQQDPRFARVNEYINVLLLTLLSQTSIDRSVGMIGKIAENWMSEETISLYPTVSAYVNNPKLYNPKTLFKKSHQLFISKKALYSLELHHANAQIDVYGPQAIKLLFPQNNPRLNSILKKYIQQSDQAIAQNGAELYPLMQFQDGKPLRFRHSDYRSYFAISYIMKSFNTDDPLYYALEMLLLNPKYAYELEFLNIQVNAKQSYNPFRAIVTRKLETAPNEIALMLDHLIEHRFSHICSAVIKTLDRDTITSYLTDSDIILHTKKNYVFGILAKSDIRQLEYFPIKSPWQVSGTREEMIVFSKMSNVLHSLKAFGYQPPMRIQLIYAAKQNYRTFRAFMNRVDIYFPLRVLDRAMYESLNTLGINSVSILQDLQALGGNVQRVNVNGRTLFHAAVKWCNTALLHSIFRLGVQFIDSVDNDGKTALFELLDAGMPFNNYVDGNSWSTLKYLLSKGADFSCNIQLITREAVDYLSYTPDLSQVPLALGKMMVYTTNKLNVERSRLVDNLRNYFSWIEVDIPPGVQGMRRKLIIKKCIEEMMRLDHPDAKELVNTNIKDFVTLSEILLLHREIDNTVVVDLEKFQSSIARMIEIEAPHYNKYQEHRVFTLLAHQCRDGTEIELMMGELKKLKKQLSQSQLKKLQQALEQREAHFKTMPERGRFVDTFVVKTINDLEHDMPDMENLVERIRQMELVYEGESDENISPEVAGACQF